MSKHLLTSHEDLSGYLQSLENISSMFYNANRSAPSFSADHESIIEDLLSQLVTTRRKGLEATKIAKKFYSVYEDSVKENKRVTQEKDSIEADINDLVSRIKSQAKEIEDKEKRIENMSNEAIEIERDYKTMYNEAQKLRSDIKVMKEEKEKVVHNKKHSWMKVEQDNEEILELKESLKDYKEDLEKKLEMIEEGNQKIKELKAALGIERSAVEKFKGITAGLKKENLELKDKLDEINCDKNAQDEIIENLNQELIKQKNYTEALIKEYDRERRASSVALSMSKDLSHFIDELNIKEAEGTKEKSSESSESSSDEETIGKKKEKSKNKEKLPKYKANAPKMESLGDFIIEENTEEEENDLFKPKTTTHQRQNTFFVLSSPVVNYERKFQFPDFKEEKFSIQYFDIISANENSNASKSTFDLAKPKKPRQIFTFDDDDLGLNTTPVKSEKSIKIERCIELSIEQSKPLISLATERVLSLRQIVNIESGQRLNIYKKAEIKPQFFEGIRRLRNIKVCEVGCEAPVNDLKVERCQPVSIGKGLSKIDMCIQPSVSLNAKLSIFKVEGLSVARLKRQLNVCRAGGVGVAKRKRLFEEVCLQTDRAIWKTENGEGVQITKIKKPLGIEIGCQGRVNSLETFNGDKFSIRKIEPTLTINTYKILDKKSRVSESTCQTSIVKLASKSENSVCINIPRSEFSVSKHKIVNLVSQTNETSNQTSIKELKVESCHPLSIEKKLNKIEMCAQPSVQLTAKLSMVKVEDLSVAKVKRRLSVTRVHDVGVGERKKIHEEICLQTDRALWKTVNGEGVEIIKIKKPLGIEIGCQVRVNMLENFSGDKFSLKKIQPDLSINNYKVLARASRVNEATCQTLIANLASYTENLVCINIPRSKFSLSKQKIVTFVSQTSDTSIQTSHTKLSTNICESLSIKHPEQLMTLSTKKILRVNSSLSMQKPHSSYCPSMKKSPLSIFKQPSTTISKQTKQTSNHSIQTINPELHIIPYKTLNFTKPIFPTTLSFFPSSLPKSIFSNKSLESSTQTKDIHLKLCSGKKICIETQKNEMTMVAQASVYLRTMLNLEFSSAISLTPAKKSSACFVYRQDDIGINKLRKPHSYEISCQTNTQQISQVSCGLINIRRPRSDLSLFSHGVVRKSQKLFIEMIYSQSLLPIPKTREVNQQANINIIRFKPTTVGTFSQTSKPNLIIDKIFSQISIPKSTLSLSTIDCFVFKPCIEINQTSLISVKPVKNKTVLDIKGQLAVSILQKKPKKLNEFSSQTDENQFITKCSFKNVGFAHASILRVVNQNTLHLDNKKKVNLDMIKDSGIFAKSIKKFKLEIENLGQFVDVLPIKHQNKLFVPEPFVRKLEIKETSVEMQLIQASKGKVKLEIDVQNNTVFIARKIVEKFNKESSTNVYQLNIDISTSQTCIPAQAFSLSTFNSSLKPRPLALTSFNVLIPKQSHQLLLCSQKVFNHKTKLSHESSQNISLIHVKPKCSLDTFLQFYDTVPSVPKPKSCEFGILTARPKLKRQECESLEILKKQPEIQLISSNCFSYNPLINICKTKSLKINALKKLSVLDIKIQPMLSILQNKLNENKEISLQTDESQFIGKHLFKSQGFTIKRIFSIENQHDILLNKSKNMILHLVKQSEISIKPLGKINLKIKVLDEVIEILPKRWESKLFISEPFFKKVDPKATAVQYEFIQPSRAKQELHVEIQKTSTIIIGNSIKNLNKFTDTSDIQQLNLCKNPHLSIIFYKKLELQTQSSIFVENSRIIESFIISKKKPIFEPLSINRKLSISIETNLNISTKSMLSLNLTKIFTYKTELKEWHGSSYIILSDDVKSKLSIESPMFSSYFPIKMPKSLTSTFSSESSLSIQLYKSFTQPTFFNSNTKAFSSVHTQFSEDSIASSPLKSNNHLSVLKQSLFSIYPIPSKQRPIPLSIPLTQTISIPSAPRSFQLSLSHQPSFSILFPSKNLPSIKPHLKTSTFSLSVSTYHPQKLTLALYSSTIQRPQSIRYSKRPLTINLDSYIDRDPIKDFFILVKPIQTCQSIKFNSKLKDKIGTIPTEVLYQKVLQEKVPFYKWYQYVYEHFTHKLGKFH